MKGAKQVLERIAAALGGASPASVMAGKRNKWAVRVRHVTMLALRRRGLSFPQIGAALGGMDHTTVINGCTKAAVLEVTDDAVRDALTAEAKLLAEDELQERLKRLHRPRGVEPRLLGAVDVAAMPADMLYLVMNAGLWWNRRGQGYGSDPGAAEVWTRDQVLSQMRASPERHDKAVRADAFLWGDARLADQAFRIWRGRGPHVHELRTWPAPFGAVWSGAKRAEMRRDDRGFEAGDLLVLREWDPQACDDGPSGYTGRKIEAIITHVLRDSQFGLVPGFVMLSILPFPAERHP